jgi:tRNA(Leu) C34 or U34 (ribose-2'-O)-methylase TrmL
VRAACDVLVQIPMAPGAVQSLNAAVAGSLVLLEAFRQRTGAASGETGPTRRAPAARERRKS